MDRQANRIVQLRQLLAERFPKLRRFTPGGAPASQLADWPAGAANLSDLLKAGLPKGAITELVASSRASGSALVALGMLGSVRQSGQWLALVDAQDSFDASALPDELLSCLLWVRCRGAAEAMRAADLLLRDDNVPMAMLDLRLSPPKQLRKIPSSQWYRLQRLIKHRSGALLVLTPFALVGSAQFRFALDSRFSLDDLTRQPEELVPELKLKLLRSHGAEHAEREMLAEAS